MSIIRAHVCVYKVNKTLPSLSNRACTGTVRYSSVSENVAISTVCWKQLIPSEVHFAHTHTVSFNFNETAYCKHVQGMMHKILASERVE